MTIRQFSLDEIFKQLAGYEFSFDAISFEVNASTFSTPEEFVNQLGLNMGHPAASLIFEAWRRLCPDKPSLALFCHDLDKQIETYRERGGNSQTSDVLAQLQHLLDENVDAGVRPRTALKIVQGHLQNDVESFLYHVIYDEVEAGEGAYAKELLEGFDRYIEERSWFEYLLIRSQIILDPEEGYQRFEEFFKKLKKSDNLDLLLEVLSFLAHSGNHSQFKELALAILLQVRLEKDFIELAELTALHFRYLSLEPLSLAIDELLKKREPRDLNAPLSDEDFSPWEFRRILEQKLAL